MLMFNHEKNQKTKYEKRMTTHHAYWKVWIDDVHLIGLKTTLSAFQGNKKVIVDSCVTLTMCSFDRVVDAGQEPTA